MCLKKYFDKRKLKKEQLNAECDLLLQRVSACLSDHEQMFNPEKCIRLESVPSYLNHCNALINETTALRLMKYSKANNGSALRTEAAKLPATIIELETRARQHNEIYGKIMAPKVQDLICPVEGRVLDEQQLSCIAKESRNHLVIAGAGTGKTTTIVGYIKYLFATQKCAANEVLVLSFTNASAAEMRERIAKETGVDVEASTFHKLGLNILSRANGVHPKISQIRLRTFIKEELKTLIKNEMYLRTLNQYILASRVQPRDAFEFGNIAEYQAYLRENPPITLLGETVKSYAEMDIANFLFENGVAYEYEKPYEIDTRTQDYGEYRPDFYLPDYNIYIEHFGIDEKGNVPDYFSAKPNKTPTQTYRESMEWKRELHRTNKTTLVECYSYERSQDILLLNLEEHLRQKGVEFHKKTPQEMWEVIRKEDGLDILEGVIDLIETVINLIKSKDYTVATVRQLNANSPLYLQRLNALLLDLIEPLFFSYDKKLKEQDEIDFNDMINDATRCVKAGKYHHSYKYVLIDEYQDISTARFSLVNAMRQDREFDLFCVGDDWQSIYRFSGSDIGHILNFERYWGIAEKSKIETTYRFKSSLIRISGNFVMKNPMQIRKALKSHGVAEEGFAVKQIDGYGETEMLNGINDELDKLPKNASVYFIGRYSFDIALFKQTYNGKKTDKVVTGYELHYDTATSTVKFKYLNRPDLDITFLTAHRSKGLQADYVFILNNKDGRMGFPSQIQDAPILNLLLDNCDSYEHAEERRLFYVALTRAKTKAFVVTSTANVSVFVKELSRAYGDQFRQFKTCPRCGAKLVKRKGQYGYFWGCSNFSKNGCSYKENADHRNKSEKIGFRQ